MVGGANVVEEAAAVLPDGPAPKAPILRILWSHGETVVPLVEPVIELGRSPSNHVRIASAGVDEVQARLVREGSGYLFQQLSASHATFHHGFPVESHLLEHDDELRIAPGTDDEVVLVFQEPQSVHIGDLHGVPGVDADEARIASKIWRLDLPANGMISMGRSPDSDLVLPNLAVTLHHARLELKEGAATVVDQQHSTGMFVNGVRVRQRRLAQGDVVRIGPYKVVYQGDTLEHHDDSRSVRLDAHEVSRVIGRKQILDHVSLRALPGEVLAIAGTSGAGKSTLLYTLNGMRPPSSGRIMVNGADLYESFEALQPLLGYVPQREILPVQLPVERALHYVARLRLPPDVRAEEMDQRIDEVMRALDLHDRRDVQLGSLSGGQQKRASIAAELISNPGLFFLDEPTSGLDPGLARRVSEIIRGLAQGNSTVVVISHDVGGLQAADKVVFLASGGRLAFIGTPREALEYFDVDDLADIYPRIESEDSAVWQQRFIESPHYQERVAPGLVPPEEERHDAQDVHWDAGAVFAAGTGRTSSAWRQLRVTVERYAEIMIRDRRNLMLLLVQAPIIAFFLALVAKSTDFQAPPAAVIEQAAVFGIPAAKLAAALPIMLAATATWFGAINAAREIVKEAPIFLRDRLSGLRVMPYLTSKVLVLSVLCLAQTAVLLAIVAAKVDLPSSGVFLWGPLEVWITLSLASFAALGMGLLISASVGNPDRAQSLVPIVLIPQLIFIGGPSSGSAGQLLSYLTITRWASEAMKISAGIPYQTGEGGLGSGELLVHWIALLAMAAAFIGLAGVQLWRRRGS